MSHTPGYDELIERLEKASGPDRRLDFDIWFAASPEGKIEREWPQDQLKMPWDQWFENWKSDRSAFPDYTTSIDAAVTLVPEGFAWQVCQENFGRAESWSRDGGRLSATTQVRADRCATPAIALCIAALKARAKAEPAPGVGARGGEDG